MTYLGDIANLVRGVKKTRVVLFLLLVISILAVSSTFFAFSVSKPYMGLRLSIHDGGWAVEFVDLTGFAREAGIQQGDRPVEINGFPAQVFLKNYEIAGLVFGRVITDLTVVAGNGRLHSVSIKDALPSRESVIEVISWFIVCVAFWATGFYVFLKKPRNAAALLLCLCGLSIGLAFSGNAAAERAIPTALWFEIAGSVMFPWLLAHFLLVLPEEGSWLRLRHPAYLLYLLPVLTLMLFPVFGYAEGQTVQWFRTVRLFEYGAGFLATVSIAFLNYAHASSFRTRQQMKIVLVSALAALVPFIILNIAPEAMWRRIYLPTGLSLLTFTFIPVGLGYAVVTRKLMDIDVVIRRSVVYGLITAGMAVILSAAIIPLAVAQKSISVVEEVLIAFALGGAATALFGPAKKGAEALVDRFFYKDRYDYRQIIQSLSISLRSVEDLTDVSRVIVGTTVHTLNLAGGCLLVKAAAGSFQVAASQGTLADTGNKLTSSIAQQSRSTEFPNAASSLSPDLAFLIPLAAGGKDVGVLCLSPKANRQDFSSNDMYLLEGIASVAAMALHSATLIRDVSIRDTFVSVASHELRTPLTSIMGYGELLLHRDAPDATRKRWLKNILDNSERLSAIVDDLLNVTRIQSGRVNIKPERVNLSDILEEVACLTGPNTDKHELTVDVERGLPEVSLDRDKFGQVIGNLLSNAVKYSPNGGHVKLLARNDKEQHRIVVSVADQGIGISPEDKNMLFTTFHRIHRPETQHIRGTGLGLYIAKEWTEAMGGSIWLESELNKGSTFFVAIPTQEDSQASNELSPIRENHDQ